MKFIRLVPFLFFSVPAFAQFEWDDKNITMEYSFGKTGENRYQCYSLNFEYFIDDHVSLNYNFDLSYTSDNIRHFHSPIGAVVGPPLVLFGALSLLSDSDGTSDSVGIGGLALPVGLVLLAIPDGVGFHIPIKKKIDINPYVNFGGIDFVRNRETRIHSFHYTWGFGSKITFHLPKNLTVSIFAEQRKTRHDFWFYGIGFGVGYYIR